MMKKNVRYMLIALMVAAMFCGLNGCSSNNNSGDTEQIITEVGDESISNEASDTEKATSGENLDVVDPNPADDDWYMKGSIYTDDKGNRLEVFFNDHGTLEFAVNGLSVYFTTVDNFEYENNWRVYTCEDGTMIVYYPGEPAHIEIGDGDYAGLYEEYPIADDDNPDIMQGLNGLAYDMSEYLEENGENYFFSPYSLCMALTILDNAADGETKNQIEGVFGIKNLQDWNEQLSVYMNREQPAEAFVTNANSLWIDKQYTLSDSDYLPRMESYYNAQIFQADFQHNPDGVKDLINQWVSENTDGMIENFKEQVSPLTIMSIINAIYFYGEWSQPFAAESTREEIFYGKSGETTVDMMHNNDLWMPYYEADELRGLSVSYGDGSKVMNILLPSEEAGKPVEELFGDLSEDEKNQFLVKLMDSETLNIQRLQLPKYSMEYSVDDLNDILKEMGIVDAFDLELADFPGIGDDIYLDEASHVAKLEVDELGSRAAAVTELVMRLNSAPIMEDSIDFIVNQPFIFFIQDKETGTILFMGQVNDLS